MQNFRRRIRLRDWRSIREDNVDFAAPLLDDSGWTKVRVPHNWETYEGYAGHTHGNIHGTAWYRRDFDLQSLDSAQRVYAFFEGVGSYATVYCNGMEVGAHAGGLTTFTVELSEALQVGKNLLAVRAHHPAGIDDLPFVCGGCWGSPHTEGSQPFGVFRPAWLEFSGPVRFQPFGVHIWTPVATAESAEIDVSFELWGENKFGALWSVKLSLLDPYGNVLRTKCESGKGSLPDKGCWKIKALHAPKLWSPENAHLYHLRAEVSVDGVLSHLVEERFGIRSIEWPEILQPDKQWDCRSRDSRGQLLSNGDEPPSVENNLHTKVLNSSAIAGRRIRPCGVSIQLVQPDSFPEHARLLVELALDGASPAMISMEIQNEAGTVFLQQFSSLVDDRLSGCQWWTDDIYHPEQWWEGAPTIYRLVTEIRSPDGALWERAETTFGFRLGVPVLNVGEPKWKAADPPTVSEGPPPDKSTLRINGRAVFLNGTCAYEHLLGADHAWDDEQVSAFAQMVRAAGFNAFRDAHHPHNLRFYDHWDESGLLCWTQMGSHIWFDTQAFRRNFKTCVREWVRERRNHPSIILWGIQNESALPEDFTREIRDLIRELDPTSPAARPTTTCNGGKGSDWNVPQEWSGTYGGNCADYDPATLQMVGEYGAWRQFGRHTTVNYRGDENDRSESWACHALETKIRLAHSVRDRAIGHFQWAFQSFQNPGRSTVNRETFGREEVGPVNYKGLLTCWHQPSDLFYLYQAFHANPRRWPMVYIVSHTWPNRFQHGVSPDSRIRVFSNASAVELFNGFNQRSLGRKERTQGGTFEWSLDGLEANVLHAVGYVGDQAVAEDFIQLDGLSPDCDSLAGWCGSEHKSPPLDGTLLYRVNCGSQENWEDSGGSIWLADQPWTGSGWGWESWPGPESAVSPDAGSKGFTLTPLRGMPQESNLYRTYRFGRERLRWNFAVPPGRLVVRLHLAEPWFGVGSSGDCTGWRLFDIALNGRTKVHDLDVWRMAGGHHCLVTLDISADVDTGLLALHFPRVACGQALIFAIEIAHQNPAQPDSRT